MEDFQKLKITPDGKVFLDGCEIRNVKDYELKNSAECPAEFTVTLNVTVDSVGFDSCDLLDCIDGVRTDITLRDIATCDLVEELKNREGVKTEYSEPHEDKQIIVNGPAQILIVID